MAFRSPTRPGPPVPLLAGRAQRPTPGRGADAMLHGLLGYRHPTRGCAGDCPTGDGISMGFSRFFPPLKEGIYREI